MISFFELAPQVGLIVIIPMEHHFKTAFRRTRAEIFNQ
jgi:hypothetical protein